MSNLFENNGAEFSPCGKYRYALWRIWDDVNKPLVMWIGLNPSTANATDDDPTIQSVTRITRHNGYGGFFMMNLFGIISADPKVLKVAEDPQGDNLMWHGKIRQRCKDIVFAWGAFKEAGIVSAEMVVAYPGALCIGKTQKGQPLHPLYQRSDSELIKF
jgi:hypothetical protein